MMVGAIRCGYYLMFMKGAHTDKGGSPEYFEAVTRAYAYLSEILMFMKGGVNSMFVDKRFG